MNTLPIPSPEAIIFEDEKLYVTLAAYPLTKGHTVVVWKKPVADLHLLDRADYDYLMEIVDVTRNALLDTLHLEKVYLLYMDEVKQVHWHLVPRYDEQGMNVLAHRPEKTTDCSLGPSLRAAFRNALGHIM